MQQHNIWKALTTASLLLVIGCDAHRVDCAAPYAPVNVYSMAGDHRVTVLWTPIDPDYTYSFAVYRSPHPRGPFAFVGETESDLFVDGSTHNGVTYYYAVASVGPCGEESELSIETAVETPRPEGSGAVLADANGSGWRRSGWDFSHFRAVPWDSPFADVIYLNDGGVGYMIAADGNTDIQDAGYTSFENVNWAPEGGWSPTGSVEVIEGHAVLVWTRDNHYAKVWIVHCDTQTMVMDWAYQTAEGNPHLKPGVNAAAPRIIRGEDGRLRPNLEGNRDMQPL